MSVKAKLKLTLKEVSHFDWYNQLRWPHSGLSWEKGRLTSCLTYFLVTSFHFLASNLWDLQDCVSSTKKLRAYKRLLNERFPGHGFKWLLAAFSWIKWFNFFARFPILLILDLQIVTNKLILKLVSIKMSLKSILSFVHFFFKKNYNLRPN